MRKLKISFLFKTAITDTILLLTQIFDFHKLYSTVTFHIKDITIHVCFPVAVLTVKIYRFEYQNKKKKSQLSQLNQ